MKVPTRPGTVVPVLGAAVAAAALVPSGVPAAVAGTGIPLFALASRYRWGLLSHLGGLAIVFGIAIAGVGPLPLGLVLVATVASVVAWDASTTAIALDAQVSPAATTHRAEAVHTGATLVVGTLLGGIVFLLSLVGSDTVPAVVAVFAIGGAVALLLVVDPRPG